MPAMLLFAFYLKNHKVMKYPKPKNFEPSEEEFSEAATKVSANLSSHLGIRTPKGELVKGKRNAN